MQEIILLPAAPGNAKSTLMAGKKRFKQSLLPALVTFVILSHLFIKASDQLASSALNNIIKLLLGQVKKI